MFPEFAEVGPEIQGIVAVDGIMVIVGKVPQLGSF
jgi:hypothetical protein